MALWNRNYSLNQHIEPYAWKYGDDDLMHTLQYEFYSICSWEIVLKTKTGPTEMETFVTYNVNETSLSGSAEEVEYLVPFNV